MSSPGATDTDPAVIWRLHTSAGNCIHPPGFNPAKYVSTLVVATRAQLLAVIYPYTQQQRIIYERTIVHQGFADFVLPQGGAALFFHLVERLGEPRYRAR